MKPELNERIGSYVIDLSLPPSSDALTSFIEIHCNPLQSIGIRWNPLESVGIGTLFSPFYPPFVRPNLPDDFSLLDLDRQRSKTIEAKCLAKLMTNIGVGK